MKSIHLLIALFFNLFLFAQVPTNYYDSALGLTGYALKSELHSIISSSHISQTYDDLYQGYITSDSDYYYENDGSVLDMYSEKPLGVDSYYYDHGVNQCGNYSGEGDCYNREHIVPQSVFNEQNPMVDDIHFVVPTDGYVNNRRSNYPYGIVTSPSWTSLNGSKVGSNTYGTDYSGNAFEPIDEFKGDIARMLFYFATRYETQVDSWSFPMFNGTEDQVFTDWALEMLIEWHNADPVSQREIDRNNACYNFQNNANPFINHPEWVGAIWNPTPDTEAPSIPQNLIVVNVGSTTVNLSWDASSDNVGVEGYNIYQDGTLIDNVVTTTYTATGLSPLTSYQYYVIAYDASNNVSSQSNTVTATTTEPSSTGEDLFFSEYIEGSSYNKALEIANFTGATVDLSSYTIAKNSNGAGGWGTQYQLVGTIADQDVFVLAHSGFTSIPVTPDQVSGGYPVDFNGNDPIGLFKDGVLIDIIGVLNGGSADFAANVTLVRKDFVTGPNTTFDLEGEWDSYPQNTFDYLGSHTVTLGVSNLKLKSIKLYPNPVKDFLHLDFDKETKIDEIKIFSILGKKIMQSEFNSTNSIDVSNLQIGLYLIEISSENTSQFYKFLKE